MSVPTGKRWEVATRQHHIRRKVNNVDCRLTVTRENIETPFEVGCILTVVCDKPLFTSENLLPIADYIADFKERYPHMEVTTNIQVPFKILAESLKTETQ